MQAMVAERPTDRPLLSVTEVAELIGCSRQHIFNVIRRGDAPSVRVGRRVFLPRKWVDLLVEQGLRRWEEGQR